MIVRDAILHYVHFLCIFSLASLLVAELFLLRKDVSGAIVAQLQVIDRWYGITAGLVVVSGVLLVLFGLKGAQFYIHNAIFWIKMALFVAVALVSIVPTIAFLRWNRRQFVDGFLTLENTEYTKLRALLWAEIALFTFIPLCAALLANGI